MPSSIELAAAYALGYADAKGQAVDLEAQRELKKRPADHPLNVEANRGFSDGLREKAHYASAQY